MDYSTLEEWDAPDLRKLMKDMGLKCRRSKHDMINDIRTERTNRYKIIKQIGNTGKDAITYHVKLGSRNYAMKSFKPKKSSRQIEKEVEFQKCMAELKLSPKIIDVDYSDKYIIMEKLDKHLIDINDNKNITIDHQKQLIKIYDAMDSEFIFHGDPNPLNYMIKGKKLYVIDFGMSKNITNSLIKKMGTDYPNKTLMNLAMVLKLKTMNYPKSSYSYLVKNLSKEQKETFKL